MAQNRAGWALALGMAAALVLGIAAPGRADDGTTVSFSERAERLLARDRLTAELAVDATNGDAARLQSDINDRMAKALALAKGVTGVSVASSGYNVYQERPDKGPARWHGRQGLHLEAKDMTVLLQLIGGLQEDGLVLTNLTAGLSPEATGAVEDELTTSALHRVQERAQRIAEALNLRVARIKTLRVGNAAPPQAQFRALAMAPGTAAAGVPPVAEPGDAMVAVTVDAEVELAARP
jgi:uncharacterized protein